MRLNGVNLKPVGLGDDEMLEISIIGEAALDGMLDGGGRVKRRDDPHRERARWSVCRYAYKLCPVRVCERL